MPLLKTVLILLELTAAVSATDAAIHSVMISCEEWRYHENSQITWRIWFIDKKKLEKPLKVKQTTKTRISQSYCSL